VEKDPFGAPKRKSKAKPIAWPLQKKRGEVTEVRKGRNGGYKRITTNRKLEGGLKDAAFLL